ncbi:MAG TPA: cation:dicarboxylase symporter family transporter, partial [Sphingomicrobium sp.]|nr:cation:dicarboxylase symporter family transporter [Sphingomicrobium sp.]
MVDGEAAAAKAIGGIRAWLVLAGLILGLIGGTIAARLGDGLREPAIQAASVVGSLWLNALKMTVIPLIVALLVTGVARTTEAARGG